jgi:hypothetical protein
MKRLIGVVVVLSVLFTAGIANAGLMYYLMPTGGNTSSYTITGSGTAASPYTVNITAGTGAGSIPFELVAAIQSSDLGANDGWFGTDFLAISNAAAGGSQLIGTFSTTGASPVMTLQGSAPYASGNTAVWLEGDPGIVTSHGKSSDAGASAGSGMPAQVFWSGGTIYQTGGGLGTVGPQYSTPVANLSGFTGSVPNWGNYITPNAGTDTVWTTTSEVTGSSPNGNGWYDVPLGTFKYTYGANGLTSGQSTQLDIHQVAGGSAANPLYYGGADVNNVITTQGIKATADNAIVINYGATPPPDTSVLALTPATVPLGRVLVSSAGAYVTSSGSITNAPGVTTGNYTLATVGVTLQSATSGSVLSGSNSGYLNFTVPSSPGAIAGTVSLTNTGNSADNNSNPSHTMTVTGTAVAMRGLTVTTTVPVAGSYLQGNVVNLTLTDAAQSPDSGYTTPSVNQLNGSPASWPGSGGVYVNGVGTTTISSATSTYSAPLQMVFATTGSNLPAGTIDLGLGTGGVVQQEAGLDLLPGHLAIPANTYTVTIPSYTIGLATLGAPLTGTGPTSAATVSGASLSSFLSHANGSLHTNGSKATLYGMGMGTTATPVSTTWRVATAADLTKLTGAVSGGSLASDVDNVQGITGSQAFVMQMSYDYSGNAAAAAAAGKLFLGYLVPSGTWTNAGQAGKYNAAALSTVLAASSLSSYLGDYGIDTSTGTAWAVLSGLPPSGNNTVDFAVPAATIPEPSTLALLAAGGIAAGLVWRRRKRA